MAEIKKRYHLVNSKNELILNSNGVKVIGEQKISAPLEIPFNFGGIQYTAHLIGDTYWLTQNFNYFVGDSHGFNTTKYWYVNNTEFFGQYYSFETMLNVLKPVIPSPWRIATETDLFTMFDVVKREQNLSSNDDLVSVLASKNWIATSTNAYNFNAVNNGGSYMADDSFFDYGADNYLSYFNLQVDTSDVLASPTQRRLYLSNYATYGKYGYGDEDRWYGVRLVIDAKDYIETL